MAITITLPDTLAARLETEAQAQRRSAEEVAVELLDRALDAESEPPDYIPPIKQENWL